jgi:hypothetical protein
MITDLSGTTPALNPPFEPPLEGDPAEELREALQARRDATDARWRRWVGLPPRKEVMPL